MKHIGHDTAITIEGKTYKLSRFTRKILRDFMTWADKVLGSPLDAIRDKLQGFPKEIQELMVKDALEQARLRRSFYSPEIQALMQTVEGASKILHLLFNQYHPEINEAQAEALYEAATAEHGPGYMEGKISECAGVMPKDESEAEADALRELGALPQQTFQPETSTR